MGALKKPTSSQTPSPKEKKSFEESSATNQIQKAEIERIKRLLSEKIKDPNLAKKAALIISEMLNK